MMSIFLAPIVSIKDRFLARSIMSRYLAPRVSMIPRFLATIASMMSRFLAPRFSMMCRGDSSICVRGLECEMKREHDMPMWVA